MGILDFIFKRKPAAPIAAPPVPVQPKTPAPSGIPGIKMTVVSGPVEHATAPKAARKTTRKATHRASRPSDDDDRFQQEIVGESYYQDALEKICGKRTEEGENRIVEARIIPDDKNQHDKLAVRIEINGHLVGHLSREDARAYRARLKREGRSNAPATCQAKIKGGWKRKGSTGSYGVWLDIPELE